MFCFQAAAAGWHSGALVIDLDVSRARWYWCWMNFEFGQPGAEEEEPVGDEVEMPGRFSGTPTGGGCFPLPRQMPGELPGGARHSQIVSHTFAPFHATPGPVIPQNMPPTVAQQQQQQQEGGDVADHTPGLGRGLIRGVRIGFAGRGRGLGPRGVAPDRGNPH